MHMCLYTVAMLERLPISTSYNRYLMRQEIYYLLYNILKLSHILNIITYVVSVKVRESSVFRLLNRVVYKHKPVAYKQQVVGL